MKRAVKKTISPCNAKGRYAGKRYGAGQFTKNEDRTITVPKGCECQSGCGKRFLLQTDPEVKSFRNETGAKFRGCYVLEEWLLKHKLIRHEPFDSLMDQHRDPVFPEELEEIRSEIFIENANDEAAFLNRTINNLQKAQELYFKPHIENTSFQSDPWYVGRKLQEKLNELEDLCTPLTNKQKEAVRFVYLENEDGVSGPEIAKKLKISPESLKDRLKNALKKIQEYRHGYKFPERRKSSEDAKNWELQDSEFDGFYRKSNAIPGPVKRVDPSQLQRNKKPSEPSEPGL